MELHTNRFLLTFIFIISTIPLPSQSCKPDSCDSKHGPQVRFPFRLQNRQPARCGFPGFDLSCNSKNQTVLTLPDSGDFIVDLIDYKRQALFIHDPDSCLPNRALNFSLSGSPFQPAYVTNFVFLNCSGDGGGGGGGWMDSDYYVPLVCLSGRNSTVVAASPAVRVPAACRRVANVTVPPWWRLSQPEEWAVETKEDFEVGWREPRCGKCESRGGVCGYKDAVGLQIGCFRRSGLSRSAKYGIIIFVGISGVLCMIGVACYSSGMIKRARHPNLPNTTTTFVQLNPVVRAGGGLNSSTIDSYPKIVLGQNLRLSGLNDTVCPICLSDYQPNETLRSIPDCSHYFHAACIDEWLKLNATCPVCRKSPTPSLV